MDKFIARYVDSKGVKRTIVFDKSEYDETKAKIFMEDLGVQNFFFLFEFSEPKQFGENSYLFKGEVGWEITVDILLPYLKAGNEIVLDTFGGSLWEGLKIRDTIKELKLDPQITVLGSCASSGTLIFLAARKDKRFISDNSRFLIHNAWTWEEGNQYDLKRVSEDLAKEDNAIADIYAKESNLSKDEIILLMKEERFLNKKEVEDFGFINPSTSNHNNKSDINMTDAEKQAIDKKMSWLEKTVNKLTGKGTAPVNVVLQDTNGVELDFGSDVETEEQIVEGLEGVTANGEIAEGSYVMASGVTYVFEAGKLIEIIESDNSNDEELEALKTENAEKDAEIAELKESNNSLANELKEVKGSFADIDKQIKSLKGEFSKIQDKGNTPQTELDLNGAEREFKFKSKRKK